MSTFPDLNKKLEIVESPDYTDIQQNKPSTSSGMSGDKPPKRSGRRSGRRSSKLDGKAKLERSRQSARECRARKKLRYQYLEDLVLNREKAVFALRDELELYKQWCILVDKGKIPVELLKLLDAENNQAASSDSDEDSDVDVEHDTNDQMRASTSNVEAQVNENSFAKLTLNPNQIQSIFRRTSTLNSKSLTDQWRTLNSQSQTDQSWQNDDGTGVSSQGATGVSMIVNCHSNVDDGSDRDGVNGRCSNSSKQSMVIQDEGSSWSNNLQYGTNTTWPSRAFQKTVLEDTSASLPTILEDVES